MTDQEMLIRLAAAAGGGIVLGLDRELRGISVGIRTHAIVAVSSAMIMISALMLYDEFQAAGNASIDPLRVIQGLAQAIGFIAAGTIFVARGSVHNLTSAANVWLAAAVGIAAGAAQFALVAAGVVFGVILLTAVRLLERFIPGSRKAGDSREDRDDDAEESTPRQVAPPRAER
jgi:putative Mg2+ transporter-C (MgtC) family protein